MKIPNRLIYAVGDVLGSWYFSHTKLDTLFGECGFPGDPPPGNCVKKCQDWLKRANDDPTIDALDLLGKVLVEFMSLQFHNNPKWQKGVERIRGSLADSALTFQPDGRIVPEQALKRFRVALSFPGEHRSFVEQIAERLSSRVGRDRVLYDKYYEAEFARPNLDTYLQRLYHDESEMIAIFLCADYDRKEWCGLEWRALRDVLKHRRDDDLMPFRFDDTTIPGIFSIDGYVWIGSRTPQEVADLILHRLQVNDSQSRATLAPADPTVSRIPNATGAVTTASASKSAQAATDCYNRGLRCLSEENYDGALDALNQAIQLDSTLALAHYNRGLTHYFRHDEDLAIKDFDRALELGFGDAVLFRNRGNAFSRKGDVARALADYEQAIALEPENPIAYLNRGEVYENTLRKNLASADYNIVLSLGCEPEFKETARKRLLAMGVRASAAQSPSALVIWQKKLTFLQAEEAKAADADQKFSIQQRIEEARAKIQELGG